MGFKMPEQTVWWRLGEILTGAVRWDEWRQAPWLGLVIPDHRGLGRIHAFQLLEKPHLPQINAAVVDWLDGKPFPQLQHPASYFLAARFHVLGFLFKSFSGILPDPSKDQVLDIYAKFLFDWWDAHGPNYGVGFSCAEFDPEPPSDSGDAGKRG